MDPKTFFLNKETTMLSCMFCTGARLCKPQVDALFSFCLFCSGNHFSPWGRSEFEWHVTFWGSSLTLADSEESGMVWVHAVHAGQNGLLVLPGRAAVQQGREAGVWVLSERSLLLLAEVESFFRLQHPGGAGGLGLRGGVTWGSGQGSEGGQRSGVRYRDRG